MLRIARLVHRKSNLVIICPNSHKMLTKSEIRSSLSRFEHCSESLIKPIGSHIWSLFAPIHKKSWPKAKLARSSWSRFKHCSESLVWSIGSHIWSYAPIHMKSWPKVKLGQVQVGLNIAQNHSSSPEEVISGHYLPQIIWKVDQK